MILRKFLLIIFLVSLIFSCDKGQQSEGKNKLTPVSMEGAEQFVLVDSKSDKKNWILKAGRANDFDDSVKIYVVNVEFFDSEGIYYSTLTSDSGIVFSRSGDMRAMGNVRVVSKDSTLLKTGYLDWNNKEHKIVTEDLVEITRENSIITGKGMESDPNLEHIKIKKDFNAISKDIKED